MPARRAAVLVDIFNDMVFISYSYVLPTGIRANWTAHEDMIRGTALLYLYVLKCILMHYVHVLIIVNVYEMI